MIPLPDGSMPYSNVFDCLRKTLSNEGLTKLWVGYPTFYFWIAPHVMITLICQDYLSEIFAKTK